MSKDGFDNETKIKEEINGKEYSQINSVFKGVIKESFEEYQKKKVFCKKEGGKNKSDLLIELEGKKKQIRLSVKKGSGNSVHQEPIEDFLIYLEKEFNISEDLKNDLRLFIWGDYSLDGKGKKENRLSALEFKKKFPEVIERISKFMELHKKKLIERFVVLGPKSNKKPDYIYYGGPKKGYWANTDDILVYLSRTNSQSVIPVGKLTFQAWNRAIKEDSRSEHKRGVIQLKWPTVKEDLKFLMEK